jgi:hypothetical protein
MLPVDSSLSVAIRRGLRPYAHLKISLGIAGKPRDIIKPLLEHARRHRLHRQGWQRWMISAVARVMLQWPLLQ